MQDEQVPGFYSELEALCLKYDVEGFVGLWFSGTTDNYGFTHGSAQDGGTVSVVCKGISQKLREWCDEAHNGPPKFRVEAMTLRTKK